MSNATESSVPVQVRELALEGFKFPKDLDSDKANFRFVVDVRYVDDKGKLATHQAVMPGTDTYWECDPGQRDEPNYVRANDEDDTFASFDMSDNKVDPWDRLVFLGKVRMIHSIQVKVFDVDRPDFWDKFVDALGSLIGALFGKVKAGVPSGEGGSVQSAASGVFGSFIDDVSSTLLKTLSGGDKVLFRGSCVCQDASHMDIRGAGTAGQYDVQLRLLAKPRLDRLVS